MERNCGSDGVESDVAANLTRSLCSSWPLLCIEIIFPLVGEPGAPFAPYATPLQPVLLLYLNPATHLQAREGLNNVAPTQVLASTR